MYWIMLAERTSDNDLEIYEQPATIDALRFNLGKKVPGRFRDIVIKREQGNPGEYTDCLLAFGIPGFVFNSKVRTLLKSSGVENVDYYNAVVEDEVIASEISDYKIGNILGLVSCVDIDASDLRFYKSSGAIKSIRKLILDPEKMEKADLKLFRLAEYPQLALAHDSIKRIFEEQDVTGLSFIDPERFVL